ncbi:MAG: hypothetical protein KJ941_08550 [Bacteroidetes bacterium]|nr:hypothetical protein [Bacteroidota bacterium]
MEKLKIKKWLLLGVMATGILGTGISIAKEGLSLSFDNNPFSQMKSKSEDSKANTASQDATTKKASDVLNLKMDEQSIPENATELSKKELRKAKADLKKEKKQLKMERKFHKTENKLAFQVAKRAKKSCSKDLRIAKRELRKDLRKGNASELTSLAQRIDYLTWKKQQLELAMAS